MKYWRLSIVFFALAFSGLVLAGPRALEWIGACLVVDEKAGRVDAVVSGGISRKVLDCYKRGRCGKIIIVIKKEPEETWQALRKVRSEDSIRNRAREAGIDDKDLIVHRVQSGSRLEYIRFLKKFFSEHKIHSALFLYEFYKTRGNRFYLDRYFQDSGVAAYVQPYREDYQVHFERWWRKNRFANYFLDEYLGMAWYFFNRLLGSDAV